MFYKKRLRTGRYHRYAVRRYQTKHLLKYNSSKTDKITVRKAQRQLPNQKKAFELVKASVMPKGGRNLQPNNYP